MKDVNDLIPPAPICDLSADASTPKAVFLTWKATGDDGDTGRSSFYDIRYSLNQITEGNFNSASPISMPTFLASLAPKLSGAIDGITACNLLADTLYYFALKVLDEAGNTSSISNCNSIRTLPEPAFSGSNFPHIKTHLGLPIGGTEEEQVKWEATHFDFTIGNPQRYKKYNPEILGIFYTCPNTICDITNEGSYANRLKKRCEESGICFEDMLLHFAEDTRVKLNSVEGVIKGWDFRNDRDGDGIVSDGELPFINGSATARNRQEARLRSKLEEDTDTHFRANMGNNFYRQTLVDFISENMDDDLGGGVEWDGVHFDCLETGDIWLPEIISGGKTIEYPDTRNYREDYIEFLNETRKEIKDKIMRGAIAKDIFSIHSKLDAFGAESFFSCGSSIDTFESNSNLLDLERTWGQNFL